MASSQTQSTRRWYELARAVTSSGLSAQSARAGYDLNKYVKGIPSSWITMAADMVELPIDSMPTSLHQPNALTINRQPIKGRQYRWEASRH